MNKNRKVLLVMFALVLFCLNSCTHQTEDAAGTSSAPPNPPGLTIEEIVRQVTFRYFLYREENTGDASILDTYSQILRNGTSSDTYNNHLQFLAEGSGGFALIERLYQWHEDAKSRFPNRTTNDLALTNEWMEACVTNYDMETLANLSDAPDIAHYEAKTWELCSQTIKTDIPYTDERYVPNDYKIETYAVACTTLSRIAASWDVGGIQQTLDCWYIVFEIDESEGDRSQMVYFVNTNGDDDSVIWIYIRSFLKQT